MHDLSSGLFLNIASFCALQVLFAARAQRSIVPFDRNIHTSLYSDKSNLNIGALNLTFLFPEY